MKPQCIGEGAAKCLLQQSHHSEANYLNEALVMLREAGVDLGVADNNGGTPARYATQCKHPDCEALLKEWGY